MVSKLLNILKFKKKVENLETTQEHLEGNYKIKKKKKKKSEFIVVVIFVSALGFSAGYIYFNFFVTPNNKPLSKTAQVNQVNRDIFNNTIRSQNIPPQSQSNPQSSQTEIINKQPGQNSNEPNKQSPNTTEVASSNKFYIPAKDILINTTLTKQELENQIAILKSQVELKKLENELEKIQEDKKLIPFSTKVQLNKLTQEIAEKRVEPVKVPVIPPDLLGVYQINGKKIGIFLLGGIQIKASEGEYVGEFMVQNIQNDQATVKDSQGRIYNIAMKLPDKYSVGQSMFKKGKSVQTTRVISSSTGFPGTGPQPGQVLPPTYVPIQSEISSVNVYKGK